MNNGDGNKSGTIKEEAIQSAGPQELSLDPVEQAALLCILAAAVYYVIKKRK